MASKLYDYKINKFLWMYVVIKGSYIKYVGFAFTREGAWKKMCRKLGIAYFGPDSDGK